MRKTLLATTLLATIAATPAAFAHEAGDIIVRAGAVTVTTHESTSGVKTSDLGNLNGKATLNNDTQLGLNFAYMVTDNIGIELLAASPFKHDVHIKNTDVGSMKLGSIKHLPPTLSAVYYPLDSKSAFQPYIGAGINYTWFFDESLSSTAKQGLNASNFKVKNSWGWAAQVGADYMLTDNIMINGQIRYIDIDTDATLNTVAGRTKVNVDVKPWVYMVGLGYKF